ncbi:hypothetical protein CJ178_31505 [Rhodococcus sp. ACPA4]|nr:hypothetical protein CJ178_31505 [Rhodococcus sp. ACPA4]
MRGWSLIAKQETTTSPCLGDIVDPTGARRWWRCRMPNRFGVRLGSIKFTAVGTTMSGRDR